MARTKFSRGRGFCLACGAVLPLCSGWYRCDACRRAEQEAARERIEREQTELFPGDPATRRLTRDAG